MGASGVEVPKGKAEADNSPSHSHFDPWKETGS